MDIYRVSFIGHRDIDDYNEVEEAIYEIVSELIRTKDFVEFLIGRNGEFDIFCASCVKRLQKKYGTEKSSLVLVLPYTVADLEHYENYYDDVMIPDELCGVHFKAAITKRNRWFVDNSDMLIAYVKRATGGAFECLKYAEKKTIEIKRI